MHRDFWSPGLSTHPTIDAPWTLAVRSPSLAYENLATEASCVNQIISNWVPHIVIFLSFQDPKGAMVKTWWDSQSSDSMDFLERWCEWTPYPIYIYTGWWYTKPSEKYESQLGVWISRYMEK